MEEVWELLTGLKCALEGKRWLQKLKFQLPCFNCTQLYHIYGGLDCSSKTMRLLHEKTGLHVSTVGILLLRLVFAQVHHYSIEELDAPEER